MGNEYIHARHTVYPLTYHFVFRDEMEETCHLRCSRWFHGGDSKAALYRV